ncbi:MAG TPA: hypothetical protein VF521_07660, partial [Pyrinomonadaceae bacterium]
MRESLQDEEQIRRYLLGELSEAEMTQLEDAAFAGLGGEELQGLIASAENDLMDEYARGELLPDERARFEARFLNSERRRARVGFAAALAAAREDAPCSAVNVIGDAPPARSPSTRVSLLSFIRTTPPALIFALASCALALAAVAVWYATDASRRRTEAARVEAERRLAQERASAEEVAHARQGARERQGPHEASPSPSPQTSPSPAPQRTVEPYQGDGTRRSPAPAIASFTLLPGSLRGEGDSPQTISLPRGSRFIRLRLVLDEVALRGDVRAEIFADERKVLSRAGLRVRRSHSGSLVTLDLPVAP